MSLTIQVSCAGRALDTLYGRGPVVDLGLDEDKLPTINQPRELLATAYCSENQWFVETKHGQDRTLREVFSKDSYTIKGLTFKFVPISSRAEVLSRSANFDFIPLKNFGGKGFSASYTLAGLTTVLQLEPGLSITAGRSQTAAISIPLDSVQLKHCCIKVDDSTVSIRPLAGQIAVNGERLDSEAKIAGSCVLALLPSGLELSINTTG